MADFFKTNKILVICVAIALAVACVVIGMRYSVEAGNKTYDIVLDYNEIDALAEQSGDDVETWLGYFRDMGITKVGLLEESIITLMEDSPLDVTGEVMDNVVQEAGWKDDLPEVFTAMIEDRGYDSFDVLVRAKGKDACEFVTEGLTSRMPQDKLTVYYTHDDSEGDSGYEAYILIDGTPDVTLYSQVYKYLDSVNGGFAQRRDIESSKILYVSLGLLPEKVEKVQGAGMEIIPRTLSYDGWNDTRYAEAVIAGYEKYGIVPKYMIAGGESLIGCDDGIETAKKYITDNGITIGLIENTTQLQNILQTGVEEVAISTGYDTVRVFSVWDYIQYRYKYYGYQGAEEVENTLFRAVTERNIRIIYFKPVKEQDDRYTYVTDVDTYRQMFSNLETRLARHGFTFGEASVMRELHVPRAAGVVIGWGAALGAVLLLAAFWPIGRRWKIILSALGVVAVAGAYFVAPGLSALISSFAAAVVFACLGVAFYTLSAKRAELTLKQDAFVLDILKPAILTLVVSVLIAFAGGLMTAAPISSINYMLEIDTYRGVKMAQLLPIAFFVVAFLAYFGYGKLKTDRNTLEFNDIRDLLNVRISLWMILIAAVIGAVGYYYIMRTGHDSNVEVSGMEMLFRNKLEELLLARPRTKEFMIAFPAIMLTVYCAVRRLKFWTVIFGIAGVLGMTSVCNTFMHIRTPLYLGFVRTGYSLIFGIIIGTILVIVFDFLYRIYVKRVRKYFV